MPLNTDLNVAPFFDDYDANNQYYRILFRPGTAVQARELTQVQSILQDQVESFGNWAFSSGDIVQGCKVTPVYPVPFVRLADTQTNGVSFDTSIFTSNTLVVSNTSGLQARIYIANNGLSANYPDTNVIYVNYKGSGSSNQTIFAPNDVLNFYNITPDGVSNTPFAVINTYSNTATNTYTTGTSHLVTVSPGMVYMGGEFVKVVSTTYGIVNAYGTYAANNLIGLVLNETIITENQDSSLLDNALGYSNENAPGAYRLKLVPQVLVLDPNTAANTAGFSPIGAYNFGNFIAKEPATTNVYSVVGEAMANRFYDTTGNYIINPFNVDTISGVSNNSIVTTTNSSIVFVRVSAGSGYAQGKPVGFDRSQYIATRRAIDTDSRKQQEITFNYGSFFILNEVAGSFDFTSAQTIQLYDTYQTAVTRRVFSGLSPSGNNIGTAQLRCFSYEGGGTQGSNSALYILHIFNIKLNSGYNTNQIKSVYYNGTNKGVGDLFVSGTQQVSNKTQLFNFGRAGLKNLRDVNNNNNTEYTYRTKKNYTMYANGSVVVTLGTSATGGIDQLPYYVSPPSALPDVDALNFTVTVTQQGQSNTLAGTVNVNSSNGYVIGTSTTFANNFALGDQLLVGSDVRTILNISNNTIMQVDAAFSAANTAANHSKYYSVGKIIPIQQFVQYGPTSNIVTSNTTSFTINTGQIANTTLTVDVSYDILRTQVVPASKNISKNRFVKIDTRSNPSGPWCLGYSDVHKITKVYGSADGSYTTSGLDLTTSFVFDSGQKDTHYDLGYIYSTGSYNQLSYPYLLVQLDYFIANTAAGSGFFTVESYPINDSTYIANTSYIATKDIPLYVDESGTQNWLRDFVDFRIPSTSTATDTGDLTVDSNGLISNATQITSAISSASVNPSNSVSLSIPVTGLNIPSYGYNLQADYTYYLPRKDLIFITPDDTGGKLSSKEGVSSISPQTPLFPDNGMALAVLNIPPYPSLAADEIDADKAVNQISKNLIRDTSTTITVSPMMNRRYTMKDIGKLDNRITNLEYYASLSLLEQQAKDMTVTDADGLDRYKNGIFVEPFNDFTRSEISNPEFTIAIDSSTSVARPRFVTEVIKLDFNNSSSTNVQKTGRVLSLPYVEVPLIQQPYATSYRSIGGLNSGWQGSMILCPSYDNHIDTNNVASASITVDTATDFQQFANTPFGSIWGTWQTTTNTTVSTTKSGTVDTYQDGTLVSSVQQ
jgi:hypothetical protein